MHSLIHLCRLVFRGTKTVYIYIKYIYIYMYMQIWFSEELKLCIIHVHGYVVLLCCLFDLASFFLPSHLSLKHVHSFSSS